MAQVTQVDRRGRTAGYALAKRGDCPVRLLSGGSGYRICRYDLYRYLGVAEDGRAGKRDGVARNDSARCGPRSEGRSGQSLGGTVVYDQPCSVSGSHPLR